MRRLHAGHWIVITVFSFVVVGCREMTTDYGKTKGSAAQASLNGFGALRTAYENAGFRSRDITRLSDRVLRTDVIVWTPQTLGTIDSLVTRWFEKWLALGDKTLVYVVPDSGSEADYWKEAAKIASPEQRLEYRKRAAKSVNQRMIWRSNRGNIGSNGWFRIEPQTEREPVGKTDGPWGKELRGAAQASETAVEFQILPFEKESHTSTNPANFAKGLGANGPTGPSSGGPTWGSLRETKPTRTKVNYHARVNTEAGNPIVTEIESKKWKDSKIIVVAGGSLLTNYAFTRPMNRQLAERIIQESMQADRTDMLAGFLTSNRNPISVSERTPGVPKASGMELLTVWPISLVTMHGVLLGLVICLMLLPVFGRPRRIERTKASDFGDHLDAVAALMNRNGGEQYARNRISEYMKRLHGETAGPWILPDKPIAAARPLPPLTSKRLAAKRLPSAAETTLPQTTNPIPPSTASPIDSSQSNDSTQSTSPGDAGKSDNHEAER